MTQIILNTTNQEILDTIKQICDNNGIDGDTDIERAKKWIIKLIMNRVNAQIKLNTEQIDNSISEEELN